MKAYCRKLPEDTANEVGDIEQCLYSTGNRIEICKVLLTLNKTQLLETALEDLFRGVQDMFDEHSIVKEEK